MRTKILILLVSLLVFSCKKEIVPKRGKIAKNAMVVSAREEASKIGSDILQQGGNAFDAMFATEMALAVTYPYAGNLGGGGFMVYRLNTGETGALDYREKAPLAASKNMYLDSLNKVIPNKSTVGAYAVGVPGTIAGIFSAHEKFGTLPVETLLKPVIALAENGFVITEKQQNRFIKYDSIITAVNGKRVPINKTVKANSTFKNIALAKTLQRISNYGRDEFYTGQTATQIVRFLNQYGGIITSEDLAQYQAQWREPITFEYDNLKITSMSPPSSGGLCLAQIMKMIEPYDISQYDQNSLKTMQIIVEAEKLAYADRSYYLGDPDFVNIPIQDLLSDNYLKNRMANFSFDTVTPSDSISYGKLKDYTMKISEGIQYQEHEETTHYSIVDQFGNAVAVTTTLNGAFGSKLYTEELGFFLNNEMDDFSSKAGVPNVYGLIGGKANAIAPQKRMLSAMTPTIVEKEGQLFMVVGTPGGSTIITSVLQTILNVHEFEMTMQEAVNAPRFHHQWRPEEIRIEPNKFNATLLNQLEALGYTINTDRTPIIGKVDAILVLDDGHLEAGADYRGDDVGIGF